MEQIQWHLIRNKMKMIERCQVCTEKHYKLISDSLMIIFFFKLSYNQICVPFQNNTQKTAGKNRSSTDLSSNTHLWYTDIIHFLMLFFYRWTIFINALKKTVLKSVIETNCSVYSCKFDISCGCITLIM
jgi:hypothetical protein